MIALQSTSDGLNGRLFRHCFVPSFVMIVDQLGKLLR